MKASDTFGTSAANRSTAWGLAETIPAPARLALPAVIIRRRESRLF